MSLPRIHFSPQTVDLPMLRYGLHGSVKASISEGVKIAPLCLNISHMPHQLRIITLLVFFTHFIFFFPSNLLLREAIVRPAGSGGGGGASGARARTRVTDGVSGGGVDGSPRVLGVPVRAAATFLFLSRRRGVPNTSDLVVETEGRTDVASWGGGIGA
jgi:hypothetical protein